MKRLFLLSVIFTLCLQASAANRYDYDVVVYGGTSAGVIAAVQAKQMGLSTVIVGPDTHLGGLSSGGLGFTDTGNKEVIGGLSREFYHRVYMHYQKSEAWKWQKREEYGNKGQGTPAIDGDRRTMWIFEPHVAEGVYEDFVSEYEIPVHRDEWLNRAPGKGVEMADGRIKTITMLSGKTYAGKMFIDATYEGDLMAAAGVEYHVGREANSVYGESWNGVQVGVLHHSHWFRNDISPYVKPGDPSSGLLPRVSAEPPGKKGEGDHRVQAYCYRMCLSNHPDNRVPFPKPQGYDASQYELLKRMFDAGRRDFFHKYDPIPNRKTDTNNHGPFSTDNIGYNYDYPDGSYAERQEILREHQTYQKGLMYFVANDPSVPDDIQEKMAQWGLAKDEFTDNGHWPHQIYVREARRMIGQYVMTEHDCMDTRETPKSVGMGSYTMDSHNVQRYIKPDGFVQNEGDIGVKPPRPYEIAYGSLVPKKGQCENLLVPICVSASHISFGSIRMEPVFMILGQSAATAAGLAIKNNWAVQDVPYEVLKKRLEADGQVLTYRDPSSIRAKELKGVVVDDTAAEIEGEWSVSTSIEPYIEDGYIHDSASDKDGKVVRFSAELDDGFYAVRLAYPANPNRTAKLPVVIYHAEGKSIVVVNQTQKPEQEDVFTNLGTFQFAADKPAVVEINAKGTEGHVVVDAVQWLKK
ncbi:FAD-dependent oxidoreductase [bacterium]|nr:FAD-dependent oxidoreductase [bacterium]